MLSFLRSLSKKEQKTLNTLNSFLIRKLKEVCNHHTLSFYENITIYHHSKKFIIPKQKFNELTNSGGVPIHNFLPMENFSGDKYVNPNNSFKELLPYQKIMFSDSTQKEILKKIMVIPLASNMPEESYIMGNLLIQFLIFTKDNSISLATKEQINFIETKTKKFQTLQAPSYSGKTSSVILRAILDAIRSQKVYDKDV